MLESKLHAALTTELPQELWHVGIAVGVVRQGGKLHVGSLLHTESLLAGVERTVTDGVDRDVDVVLGHSSAAKGLKLCLCLDPVEEHLRVAKHGEARCVVGSCPRCGRCAARLRQIVESSARNELDNIEHA